MLDLYNSDNCTKVSEGFFETNFGLRQEDMRGLTLQVEKKYCVKCAYQNGNIS